MQPTNIQLLDPKEKRWGLMTPVTSTDVVEGMSNNLHPEGLYSNEIFGRIGTKDRKTTESYIDLKLPVFIPIIFDILKQIKGLYAGIMKGTDYAIWDPEQKDFIKSNILEGETGYSFFISKFDILIEEQFNKAIIKTTTSPARKRNLSMLNEYGKTSLTTRAIVLPAGLRDIEFNPDGTMTEPELNDLYRKILFKCRSIINEKNETDNPIYDNIRWGIQESLNNVDDYLFTMIDGKRGFIQKKTSTRGVVCGSRNILTARKVIANTAEEVISRDTNSMDIGLHQSLMVFQYLVRYCLYNSILNEIFTLGNSNARLVNPKTLTYEYVEVNNDTINKWMTDEGINKLLNGFGNPHLRNNPIIVEGYYLALIYDDGKYVKIFGGMDELPENLDKKYVKPVTYAEFFYYYCVLDMESKMVQTTRYPITGIGSIFPVIPNIKTTYSSSPRKKLDEYWEKTDITFNNFPDIKQTKYFDSISVEQCREKLLGSDHDGDQLMVNGLIGSDTIAEVKAWFSKRSSYIDGTGEFLYDVVVEPQEFLLKALTGGKKFKREP